MFSWCLVQLCVLWPWWCGAVFSCPFAVAGLPRVMDGDIGDFGEKASHLKLLLEVIRFVRCMLIKLLLLFLKKDQCSYVLM
jgi:hypothetical protein